jgi:hypothetical protein
MSAQYQKRGRPAESFGSARARWPLAPIGLPRSSFLSVTLRCGARLPDSQPRRLSVLISRATQLVGTPHPSPHSPRHSVVAASLVQNSIISRTPQCSSCLSPLSPTPTIPCPRSLNPRAPIVPATPTTAVSLVKPTHSRLASSHLPTHASATALLLTTATDQLLAFYSPYPFWALRSSLIRLANPPPPPLPL